MNNFLPYIKQEQKYQFLLIYRQLEFIDISRNINENSNIYIYIYNVGNNSKNDKKNNNVYNEIALRKK